VGRASGAGIAGAVIAFLLLACGAAPLPFDSESPMVPSPLTTSPLPSPAGARDPWLSPARLEQAHRFRRAHGLRTDDAWIRVVATDPEAAVGVSAFGVPMLPNEVDLLRRRAVSVERVIAAVEAYGEPLTDTWAGAFVRPDLGTVVASFVGDLRAHEDALLEMLDPGSPLVLRGVTYSLQDLKALQTRISGDSWIAESGYHLISVGTLLPENVVRARISSGDPDAAATIIGHYGTPGMLVVDSDGTGVASWPTGVITGRVVDEAGTGLAGLHIELRGDVAGAGPSEVGVETRLDGTFDVETTATGYTLEVLSPFGPGGHYLEGPDRIVIGRARVVVLADKTTNVEIKASTSQGDAE
jgi:hypothetical protein